MMSKLLSIVIVIVLLSLSSTFVNLVLPHYSKLLKLSSVVMFFLKLCLNLFDEDIGYRFGVHPLTVSRNFYQILVTKTHCFN